MRKFVLVVLVVLIFIVITATGCSNKTASSSDSSSSSSCCKLIQFLKENNGIVLVNASGTIVNVDPNKRTITLELSIAKQSVTITMANNVKEQIIQKNHVVTESLFSFEEIQKEIGNSVIISLEPKDAQWQGVYLTIVR